MQLPFYFEFGDEDEQHIEFIPERNLYLAVFSTALNDIIFGRGVFRRNAINWVRGAPAHITFEEVRSVLKFSAKRMELLNSYIKGTFKVKKFRKRNYYKGEHKRINSPSLTSLRL